MKKTLLAICLVSALASASFAPYKESYENKAETPKKTLQKANVETISSYQIVSSSVGEVFLLDAKRGHSWKLANKGDGRMYWEQIYFENNLGDLTPEYAPMVIE